MNFLPSPADRAVRIALYLSLLLWFILPGAGQVARADTNLVAQSAAERDWQVLQKMRDTPPEPLKQLPDRMYTQQEIRDYYAKVAEQAGAVADEAHQFYKQHPDDSRAAKARDIYFNALHTAVESSSTNRVAELEAATAERQQDPKLDETARFNLSLRLLHSVVRGRQYEGDDAMRLELEIRAEQLAQEFPNHPEGVDYLLNLARLAPPGKSATLAGKILALTHDETIRDECRGLLNRAAAVGQPLSLKLISADGSALNMDQMRGKVVGLFFWDTKSKYSPKALYVVNHLYQTYHAQGLEVWGLNFDTNTNEAMAFLQTHRAPWPLYFDQAAGGKIKQRFGAGLLPMLWLVDKQGVLRETKAQLAPDVFVKGLLAD